MHLFNGDAFPGGGAQVGGQGGSMSSGTDLMDGLQDVAGGGNNSGSEGGNLPEPEPISASLHPAIHVHHQKRREKLLEN